MSDARDALISAAYQALMGDAGLAAILADGRRLRPSAAGCRVSLRDVRGRASTHLDADAVPTVEHRFEVIVHSRARGRREASDIAERVEAVLTGGLSLRSAASSASGCAKRS